MTPKEYEVLTEALATLNSPFTPDPRTVTQMAGIIDRLVQLVERQQDALDALDTLWRTHLVSEATDKVCASMSADMDDDDQLWLDQSKTDLTLLRRVEGP